MLRLLLPTLYLLAAVISQPLFAQNDKQVIGDPVLTPAEIEDGAVILYLIRFQNVGQDTAQNVVIRDTLDPRLDPNTFVTIDASHNFQVLGEGGNYIRWYFEDIELPDSASGGPNSIGYVLFSIKPRAFLAPGQTILNRACITLDDDPPICTNEAVVWIDENADIEEINEENNTYQVVPNPNYGQFEVRQTYSYATQTNPTAHWWITDMKGRTVWNGSVNSMSSIGSQVMLEKPMSGLYLLWIKTKNRLQVERFAVIQR